MASWDDGKHAGVRKVEISYGDNVIKSIRVEYVKDRKPFLGAKHGGNSGEKAVVALEQNEYLISVAGYYTVMNSENVITSLSFQTSQRTLGPIGYKTRNQFSIYLPKDTQVIGFHGKSGNALNSLEAHFGPIAPGSDELKPGGSDGPCSEEAKPGGSEPVEMVGGEGGLYWDDNDDYEYNGVRGIEIAYDSIVHSVKVTYDDCGNPRTCQRRGGDGGAKKISVRFGFPGEYITKICGSYSKDSFGGIVIESLSFQTNKTLYGHYGDQSGTPFVLSSPGKQIIGFCGRSGAHLNALGAYYGPIQGSTDQEQGESGPDVIYGGKGGVSWDDQEDADEYTGVREIELVIGSSCIQQIRFVYDDDGSPAPSAIYGGEGGDPIPVPLNFPGEHLIEVSGTYAKVSSTSNEVITSLTFKTDNKNTYGPYGFEDGTPFSLTSPGKQIIGFRGRCGAYLDALGAYYGPISIGLQPGRSTPKTLQAHGGEGGSPWNDGADRDSVRKIYVGQGDYGIHYIAFEYVKNGQTEPLKEHGNKQGTYGIEEMTVGYPNEYLTSMSGTYDEEYGFTTPLIKSLTFTTNTGNTKTFGSAMGTRFSYDGKTGQIVGFHGRADNVLDKIGAYLKPVH